MTPGRARAAVAVVAVVAAALSGGAAAATPAAHRPDGVLTVGDLLPMSGDLAAIGPAMSAGVGLAIKDIDAAGGVRGKPVRWLQGDSGDAATVATATVKRELSQGADVIIGAATSAVSLAVIDRIVEAGVVEVSPSATSQRLTTYPDRGLLFRTAPSDLLQGGVVGRLMVREGRRRVAVLALHDPYGAGVAGQAVNAIRAADAKVVAKIAYDPTALDYGDVAASVKAAHPDAILLVGYDESTSVIRSLIAAGIGPAKVPLYGVDGNTGDQLGDGLPSGSLRGVQGVSPMVKPSAGFDARLNAFAPRLTHFDYAAESYDAVTIAALAAEEAGTDAPTAVARHISDVTKGGTTCRDFASCDAIIKRGGNAAYVGKSGALKLDAAGDPTSASYAVLTFGANNMIDDSRTTYVTAP